MSSGTWISAAGARFSFTSRGDGAAVLFVHGVTLDRRMWEPQAALASRWRMLCVDLRGHGRSSPPGDAPYSNADDLAAILDAFGVGRAAVVGFGLGGCAAAQCAVAHPDRVAALALLGAELDGVDFGPDLAALFGSLGPMARDRGMSAAIDHWLGSPLFERARRLPAVEVALQRMVRDFDGAPWLRPGPAPAPATPTLARLGDIRVPALVLVGEHDHPDFHRIGRAYADGIAGAEFGVVRGAGHLLNMEAPVSVNERLEAFLAKSLG